MNLKQIKDTSYVPYSGKPSICVVKSVQGNYFPGIRIENASFPLTINAVQNALFTCLSEGEQPQAIYVQNTGANSLEFWRHEFNVRVYPIDDLKDISFKSIILDIKDRDVRNRLRELLADAVTVNSDFPVSVLLKTKQGFVSGVNIECSEWSLGLCAERIAIGKALSYQFTDLQDLYIHTRDGEYSSPCGACRQVIIEHLPHNPVQLYHPDGTQSMHYSSDLLPHSFRSSTLTKNYR